MDRIEYLIKEIGDLPVESRIRLVTSVMESLNPISPDVEDAWRHEARCRVAEYDAHAVELIPSEVVFSKIFDKAYA